MRTDFDIAIVGSGFAGSLLAMIARRLGASVLLVERGKHPRFAIGESSTPLANLLLEQLARRFHLPALLPLCKWGAWQRARPELACGLKRGFTFYHANGGELLVAASPRDEIADTHWLRADFDAFLVEQAKELGAEYRDETDAALLALEKSGARLVLARGGRREKVRAGFLVDASGPRGFLHGAGVVASAPLPAMPPTQSLFAHFENVAGRAAPAGAPYPPEDAAVHHVFDGGWIWVLHFNNGCTSAGIAATDALAAELRLHEGAPAWERALARLPSLCELFCAARARTPFVHQPRVAFRADAAAGARWALLPSAAGVVDPLLSTGFPLTLLGVERLAAILHAGAPAKALAAYSTQTLGELNATARLVGALYAQMGDFEVFSALTLLYFAAASFSEAARRLDRPQLAPSFLLCDDARFGPELRACCDAALGTCDRAALLARIHAAIAPIDVAGFSQHERTPWFPCLSEDFLAAAPKLGATREEVAAALERAGFTARP